MYKAISWIPGKYNKRGKIFIPEKFRLLGKEINMTTIQYTALPHLPHGAF